MHVENRPTRHVVVQGMYNTSLGKMSEKTMRIPRFLGKGRGRWSLPLNDPPTKLKSAGSIERVRVSREVIDPFIT